MFIIFTGYNIGKINGKIVNIDTRFFDSGSAFCICIYNKIINSQKMTCRNVD